MKQRRFLGGLFVQKMRWTLSWKGRCIVFAALVGSGIFAFQTVRPFLAVTRRVPTDYLVVEGWISPESVDRAADEFSKRGYRQIFTTGGPVRSHAHPGSTSTLAEWAAGELLKAGVPPTAVQAIPCQADLNDRTYNAALAVKQWFIGHGVTARSFNVATQGCHARRTRLLFQKAFGDETTVGVIAFADPTYDPRAWWRSSEGVRDVIGEGIAYLYARLFFHPSVPPQPETARAHHMLNAGQRP